MNPTRSQAFKMRLKGFSFNEISKELGIPKSTLSGWLRDVVLSETARTRILGRVRQGTLNSFVKRNKLQTHEARKRVEKIRQESRKLVPQLRKKDLLLIGSVLYWAEGYKRPLKRDGREITSHSISFVNSDAEMVKGFIRFLIEILEIPRDSLRLSMHLYPHINEKEALRYWMQITGVPEECFRKTTYLISAASKGKRPYNRLPYGTLQVAVYSTEQFSRLMGLIGGVKERLSCARMPPLLG